MSEWDTEHLPMSLKEMSDIIGLEATHKLVSAYGGTRLRVPVKMPETHPLAELLGLEAARALSCHYGLEEFDVPTASAAIKRARNHRMYLEHHEEGVSARRLALKYRLTERRVWEILAEGDQDDRQVDLFEA